MVPTSIDTLTAQLLQMRGQGRVLLAVVGPPGAGKSTLSEGLETALNTAAPGCAAVFPMDGYHYDDAILQMWGLRPRKGAPNTFDVDGFAHMLQRLRQNASDIAVPVFDRELEISRNGARIIPQTVELLIVEGNYLLLDQPGWRDLSALFDVTVSLRVSEAELRRRLFNRWRGFGIAESAIPDKVDANDMPNGLTVLRHSLPADYVITQADTPEFQTTL
ncbi:nucleoside/nucleotide kinase family protein [Thioclava sp. SK-1]|uniref:nucleoside triphosphate hydrolase n=1 Tax=Thioclava sp. SK-1 TaxID=1889770 RepID=UPI000827169C|nr:nucleoside triphosphate hydrolase [Thioclava sp. SK-1]OCX58190.1 nucleoside/nucleotide kinase family protein [Thioclava sp. SK-1]